MTKRAVQNKRTKRRSTSRTWMIVLAVVVIAGIAAVIAVAAGGGDDSTGTGAAAAGETAAVTVDGSALPMYRGPNDDSAVGDAAPTLTGESFDGSKSTIGPTGAPQVVMFLAHWCPHCQAEVPRIVELEKEGAFDGLGVSTVATGTDANAPNYPPSKWLAGADWPFPVMADSQEATAAEAYGISAYPFFVFVDADGKVAGRATGEISPSDLKQILDALRDGKALPTASGANSSAT